MNKLSWILLIYAVGATTYLWITRERSALPATATDAGAMRSHPGDRDERAIRSEALTLVREHRESFVREMEQRITRLQDLQVALGEELARAKALSGSIVPVDTTRIDELARELKALGARKPDTKLSDRLAEIEAQWPKLLDRVVNLELRPTVTAPLQPTPTEPKRPTLPPPDKPDAAAVRSAVAKAMFRVQSDELEVVVLGIEGVRKHKVFEALPRLIEILKTSKHEFARQAAAAALGDMKRADGVEALAEALVDKSVLVAQQANRSVRSITGFDSGISPTARIRERRRAKGTIIQWWRVNEEKVRTRLGQPKSGD